MTCFPNSIFLCNIPYDMHISTVHSLFPEPAEIVRKSVPVAPSGKTHKGYAFCTYQTAGSCTPAINALNGLHLNGRCLICRMAAIEQPIKGQEWRNQPPEESYRRQLAPPSAPAPPPPPPPPGPPRSGFDDLATPELERLVALALRTDRPQEDRFSLSVDFSRFSTAQLRSLLGASRLRDDALFRWIARMF
jgi:RNA recognition motif-containing protein